MDNQKTQLLEELSAIFAKAEEVFKERLSGYGTENISDTGVSGVLARMSDKLARLKNLVDNDSIDQNKTYDAVVDLINYSVILWMLIDGTWPGTQSIPNKYMMVREDGAENFSPPQLPGDVGYDLRAAADIHCPPGRITFVRSGVHIKCPTGLWARIVGRSSAWRNRGLIIMEGTIDSSYTGELGVAVYVTGAHTVDIKKGDRIAQVVFCESITPELKTVAELPETERGSRGFGSTGE